jgi:hypothetical protein
MIRNKKARALKRERVKQWAVFARGAREGTLGDTDVPPPFPDVVIVARAGFGSLPKRRGWQQMRDRKAVSA